jgi:hypothetical protein
MKIRLLALVGLAVSFAVPVFAQEQNTVDPEVRQQIEASIMKADEAFNRSDAAGFAADYTQDAIEVWSWEVRLALNPDKRVRKLVHVYPVGDEICAISEFEHTLGKKGYCVAIYVRELDEWKIRMEYAN